MLTGAQLATEAYVTKYGDLLCPECFDNGDSYAKPVSQYALDEWDQGVQEYGFDDETYHVEACECTIGVYCEGCGGELVEPYEDQNCEEARDERDPALD